MPRCDQYFNTLSRQNYLVSIVPIRKQIHIPIDFLGVTIDTLRFDNLTFQAAVYHKGRIHPLFLGFTIPTVVINLDNPSGRISETEFSELIEKVIVNERIEDIYSDDNCSAIFKKYGFYADRHDIRTMFFGFKKVKHLFVF